MTGTEQILLNIIVLLIGIISGGVFFRGVPKSLCEIKCKDLEKMIHIELTSIKQRLEKIEIKLNGLNSKK